MAKHSIVSLTGDGVTTQWAVSFTGGYIEEAHVTCQVNGEVDGSGDPIYRALTFISPGVIDVGGGAAGVGEEVLFRRITPISEAVNDYSGDAQFSSDNMDLSFQQILFGTQEATDSLEDQRAIEELLADTVVLRDDAEIARDNAQASETAAAASASAASASETAAASSASSAASSASTATTQASASAASAAAAATSETNAATSETNAAASAVAAATSETNASASETAAAASQGAAATSASAAATSASGASTSETNAASSATAAASSASSASTSATAAAGSATAASTSETNAGTSETNAAASEAAASTSASNASTSETNAASSASAASTSASNAATSESNAATSEANAAASYDAFDDRYLGAKASDPTLDNDGNALITGALYWNTTSNDMKVWNGSVWEVTFASLAGTLLAANNLSDVSDAGASRTNLGVAIGTDVQAYSAVLDATTASFLIADETKLDGIESGADVTDTANVTAAGALMDSELTNISAVKALNQGVATTDAPTFAGATLTGDLNLGDNDIIRIGDLAGGDLKIYHNGSDSVIDDQGTGELRVRTNDFHIRNGANTETMAEFIENGKVGLRYDNSEKLATTSAGVDVTGKVEASNNIVMGDGSGAVALTINDGYGNSNVTFNHESGIPDQNGNAARIEVNTDSTTDSKMIFSLESNVTQGVATGMTDRFIIAETGVTVVGDIDGDTVSGAMIASQAEAEAGTANDHIMTPLRVQNAIDENVSTFIATSVLSNDATADFTGFDENKYDNYLFVFHNVTPATDNVQFWVRTSSNAGTSYDSGVSDYRWSTIVNSTGGPGGSGDGDDSEIQLTVVDNVGSATGEVGVSGELRLMAAHLSKKSKIISHITFENTAGNNSQCMTGGERNDATKVSGIRFMFSSGNIESGTITMYGIRNS